MGEETLTLYIIWFLLKPLHINFRIHQGIFPGGYYCGICPMVILYFPYFFYIFLIGILSKGELPLLHLFLHLFISVWAHVYLFYFRGYICSNTIIICCSNYSRFDFWEVLQGSSYILPSHSVHFSTIFLFFGAIKLL